MFASLQSSIFQAAFRKSKIREACKRWEDRQAQKKQEMLAVRSTPDWQFEIFWTNIHPWNRCIFAEILWDKMKYLQSSHPLTKNLSGLRKGPQLCPLRRKGGLPRRWTVYPLFFLPVQKCVFKSSPAHWLISCFYRQRQRSHLLRPRRRRRRPARPRSKSSADSETTMTIILLDTWFAVCLMRSNPKLWVEINTDWKFSAFLSRTLTANKKPSACRAWFLLGKDGLGRRCWGFTGKGMNVFEWL